MTTATQTLDARGLNCPLPILRARKALNQLTAGQILEVIATDPGSIKDFASFCDQTGNRLLSSNTVDSDFVFMIEKS